MNNLQDLSNKVKDWAGEKNLIHRENVPKQMMKVIEELGELNSAILKDNKEGVIDGLGDVLVTVIILSNQLGYSPEYCLNMAYNEISGRTGRTVNGVFIKDLPSLPSGYPHI